MNISDAIECLRNGGGPISREGWNAKSQYVILLRGSNPNTTSGDYSVNNICWDGECAPFLALKTADNKLVPWTISQTDVFANDWINIEVHHGN